MHFYKVQALIFLLLFSLFSVAKAQENVAKVIIVRGEINAKESTGKSFAVTKDMWLKEGAMLESGPKSFAKLLFIDKSQISLGPDSQMVITQFPKQKAGIISLIKGQLRSQVTKDYMDMKEKDTSKLYIQTQTAAMGVRGTDFSVLFNQENRVTSLITYEGAVAMVKIDENMRRKFEEANRPDIKHDSENKKIDVTNQSPIISDQKVLEKAVSSPEAVLVREGQFSGVNPDFPKATIPTKLNPNQLEIMKSTTNNADAMTKNDKGNNEKSAAETKNYRNMVPPGVDSKVFINTSNSVEKQIAVIAGADATKTMVNDANKESAKGHQFAPPPEGFVNTKTREVAPAAGGYIDPKTALYIPPPPGSTYDANAGVYVPPPSVGTFNAKTGEYQAPPGLELRPDGHFAKAPVGETTGVGHRAPNMNVGEGMRGPASVGPQNGGNMQPSPGMASPGSPNTANGSPGTEMGKIAPPPPPTMAVAFGSAPIYNYGANFSYTAPTVATREVASYGYSQPNQMMSPGAIYPGMAPAMYPAGTTAGMYPGMAPAMYPGTTAGMYPGMYPNMLPTDMDSFVDKYQGEIYEQYNNAPPPTTNTETRSKVKFIINTAAP